MLQKAKANSRCKKCGEKGHWQGDAACKKGKGGGKGNKTGGDASKSLGARELTFRAADLRPRKGYDVVDTLVRSLLMIVIDVFCERPAETFFTKENHLRQ